MTDKHDDTFDLPAGADKAAGKPATSRRVDAKALTVAMMTPDSDVSLPGRSHAGSVVSNLTALNVNDCFTRSRLLPDDVTMGDIQDNFNAWKEELRQSINQSIRHAKKFDDRSFSTESTVTTTPSGRTYLQVIVTRVS